MTGSTSTGAVEQNSRLSVSIIISISVALFLFVAEGINYSQLAPFFPNEAELNKGLSEFLVGAITSSFDFANVIFTIFLPFIASPELNKFFFISGATFGAVGNICFGLLGIGPGGWRYAVMCFCSRIVNGMGAAMLWSTGIPTLVALAPAYAGRITSLVESGVGAGVALGPPIGSFMYALGGYMYPFLASGGIELVLVVVAAFSLPGRMTGSNGSHRSSVDHTRSEGAINNDDRMLDSSSGLEHENSDVALLVPREDDLKTPDAIAKPATPTATSEPESENTNQAFAHFLSFPGIWMVSMFFVMGSAPFGLFDVALSPYLLKTFNVDGDTAGLYYLSMGGLYAICTQFVGYAVDKGYGVYVFFWSCVATVAVSFTFSLPYAISFLESKYYIGTMLALNGIALSGTFVPVYLILENIAQDRGYKYSEDSLKLVVGIWVNFAMAVGRILGSVVFGGIVYPYLDFYKTFFITSILFLTATIFSNGYLLISKSYRTMHYRATTIMNEGNGRNERTESQQEP